MLKGWRGPADSEWLPADKCPQVVPKLVKEDPAKFGKIYVSLFPEVIIQRLSNHMAHGKAKTVFSAWRQTAASIAAQKFRVRGALNRMKNLQLSRAWEKWQAPSLSGACCPNPNYLACFRLCTKNRFVSRIL